MSKTRAPKRVKGWARVFPFGVGSNLYETRINADLGGARVARMVELRPGEVVVDVEAVVEALRKEWDLADDEPWDHKTITIIRAALRKVGVR